jgi:tetratricopeptide (TPR) repeat protein
MLREKNQNDANIKFNLAQFYLAQDSGLVAKKIYQEIAKRLAAEPKSICYNNLGYLEGQAGNEEVAINYFRKALLENPSNDYARFNYELLVRRKKKNNQSASSSNMNLTRISKAGFSAPLPSENSSVFSPPLSLQEIQELYLQNKKKISFYQQLKRNVKSKSEIKMNNW